MFVRGAEGVGVSEGSRRDREADGWSSSPDKMQLVL